MESGLPPLHGEDASVINYVKELERVQDHLDEFYNGKSMLWKKHKWDATRARTEEFQQIANSVLKLVGGSIGRKRDPSSMVVIAIGLGQFSSNMGLSSLHGTFMAYFVQLARSLDYIVVGVNEYYTSKKCPVCFEFVCQVNIRRLYCKTCKSFIHRDVMAGHNICNIVQGYLLQQQRPKYLQPVDAAGGYPWQEDLNSSTEGAGSNSSIEEARSTSGTSSTVQAKPSSGPARGSRKRKPVNDMQPQPRPTRQSKKQRAKEEEKEEQL